MVVDMQINRTGLVQASKASAKERWAELPKI